MNKRNKTITISMGQKSDTEYDGTHAFVNKSYLILMVSNKFDFCQMF